MSWYVYVCLCSCPHRTARFTVQEQVRTSITSISDKHKKIQIRSERAARDFFEKIAIFSESVMSLHRKHIVHTDLHQDNFMIAQFENMEEIFIKMIDFDGIKEIQANVASSNEFQNEITTLMDTFIVLFEITLSRLNDSNLHNLFVKKVFDLFLYCRGVRLDCMEDNLITLPSFVFFFEDIAYRCRL